MDILVFKTNVSSEEQVKTVQPYLQRMTEILRWNIDLLDDEFILRIEARHLNPRRVESALRYAGYDCEELGVFIGRVY